VSFSGTFVLATGGLGIEFKQLGQTNFWDFEHVMVMEPTEEQIETIEAWCEVLDYGCVGLRAEDSKTNYAIVVAPYDKETLVALVNRPPSRPIEA